jgi:uncharacterized membrane protein YbhN (UPF0104 family)
LSHKVHWADVGERALAIGPLWLAIAFASSFASLCIGAVRWRVMLRSYGADLSKLPAWSTLLRHNLVGQYFFVLPSGMAGEAVRGWRVAQSLPGGAAASYVLILVERIVGLLGLIAIAAAAAISSPEARGGAIGRAMSAGLVIALGLGAMAFVLPHLAARSERVHAMIARVPWIGPIVARLPVTRGVWGVLAALALSVSSQAATTMSIVALITPIVPRDALATCARVAPAIVLTTTVPITPGAVGQREAAFVKFFGLAHVDPAAATAASLLSFAVALLLSVVGGLVLLYERARNLR